MKILHIEQFLTKYTKESRKNLFRFKLDADIDKEEFKNLVEKHFGSKCRVLLHSSLVNTIDVKFFNPVNIYRICTFIHTKYEDNVKIYDNLQSNISDARCNKELVSIRQTVTSDDREFHITAEETKESLISNLNKIQRQLFAAEDEILLLRGHISLLEEKVTMLNSITIKYERINKHLSEIIKNISDSTSLVK